VAKTITPPAIMIVLTNITNAFYFLDISEDKTKNIDIGRNVTVNTFANIDNK